MLKYFKYKLIDYNKLIKNAHKLSLIFYSDLSEYQREELNEKLIEAGGFEIGTFKKLSFDQWWSENNIVKYNTIKYNGINICHLDICGKQCVKFRWSDLINRNPLDKYKLTIKLINTAKILGDYKDYLDFCSDKESIKNINM